MEKNLLRFASVKFLMTINGIPKLHNTLLSLKLSSIELKLLEDMVAANSPLMIVLQHIGEKVLMEHPDL